MDLAAIVVSGIGAGLAAALALLVVRRPDQNKWLFSAIVFLGMFGFRGLVMPHVRAWQIDRETQKALQGLRFYRALKESDPETYARIQRKVRDGLALGESPDIVASRVSPIVSEVLPKYLVRTSNGAAVRFLEATNRAISEVDEGSCFALLLPKKAGGNQRALQAVKTETQAELLDAMAEVIETAIQSPQPPPDQVRGEKLMGQVLERLPTEAASDFQVWNQSEFSAADQRTVCRTGRLLLSQILLLPRDDGGMLTRHLIGAESQ
ncbi:MAG TPA: hypothetical protein VNK82_07750 [Terriglobales bacterium]|nr:hypothetical protein [Terriglobales bacterium]